MKLLVNLSAKRFFKLFLYITLGGPVIVGIVMLLSVVTGLSEFLFIPMLYLLNWYFTPIHLFFGDYFVRISEFGMNPQGFRGYGAAIGFYVALSYIIANIIGRFAGEKTHTKINS